MEDYGVPSAATDAVMAATHPTPECGGPCATCAFRQGTEANRTPHTIILLRMCIEGLRPFYCHEQPRFCRGWIAAVNLNGVAQTEDEKRWQAVNAEVADLFAQMIDSAKTAETTRERL